jgi:hypothetical protein
LLAVLLAALPATVSAEVLDLTRASIFAPGTEAGPKAKAVEMLGQEIAARSWVNWDRVPEWPSKPDRTVIVVGTEADLAPLIADLKPPLPERTSKPEGYRIATAPSAVWVVGEDDRGVLYGVGKLLRSLEIRRESVVLPAQLSLSTSPHYPIRGHQLGYRPKTNSYDGWTVPMWEQYIRDLAIFGCNAIELIPPRSDDDADSPHFPLPPLRMMAEMSRIADSYGMDVWVWYPALDADYTDPATLDFALMEWGTVFEALPRIDAVFVPGGDPGKTPPKPLFDLMEKQTANLRRRHPTATMWFSPQGFKGAEFDEVLDLVRAGPDWLGGLVFGPQVRMALPELRKAVLDRYPIRFYPDITHSRSAQFPVPDWDLAFALTEAREVINPRPVDQAAILHKLGPLTTGFITYSEGCNDDVNKAVWSALGWDPETPILDALRDYSRYYIAADLADPFAQGLLALERNWRGPAMTNRQIDSTLAQFRQMEREATPRLLANWRFQQALYRAYYDAFVRLRRIDEASQEARALDTLRLAPSTGSLLAMDRAISILSTSDPVAPDLRARTSELVEALFQSIRMQLSVHRYQAIELGRGTSQDTIDRPLNSRAWLLDEFSRIRSLPQEAVRLAALDRLVNWTNPGPGGFYDDLGNPSAQPHLVRGPGFADDPDSRSSVLMHFDDGGGGPLSWRDQAMTLLDQPLKMRYDGLDPAASYRFRVVYSLGPIRLVANDSIEIHPLLDQKYTVLEFPIPPDATSACTLDLTFTGAPGLGGSGRAVSVLEAWLIRVPAEAD